MMLFVVEGEGGVGEDFVEAVGFGVAADFFVDEFDEAFAGEGFDGGGGAGAEFGERELLVRAVGEEGKDGVLLGRALFELGEGFFVGSVFEDDGFAGFGGVLFGANGFGEQGADDAFDTTAVVVGDPATGLEELLGDEGLGVGEGVEGAQGEAEVLGFDDLEDGAGGGAVAQRYADATPGDDGQAIGDGVVEDELGRAVDEDAGGVHVG